MLQFQWMIQLNCFGKPFYSDNKLEYLAIIAVWHIGMHGIRYELIGARLKWTDVAEQWELYKLFVCKWIRQFCCELEVVNFLSIWSGLTCEVDLGCRTHFTSSIPSGTLIESNLHQLFPLDNIVNMMSNAYSRYLLIQDNTKCFPLTTVYC